MAETLGDEILQKVRAKKQKSQSPLSLGEQFALTLQAPERSPVGDLAAGAQDVLGSFTQGVAQIPGGALRTAQALTGSEAVGDVAEGFEGFVQETFPTSGEEGGFATTTLPAAAGSFAGYALGGAGNRILQLLTGIGSQAGPGYYEIKARTEDDVKSGKITEEEAESRAWKGFLLGGTLGASEQFVGLGRLASVLTKANKATNGGVSRTMLRAGLADSAEEGTQEFISSVVWDQAAAALSDEEVALLDSVMGGLEEAAAGAILGGALRPLHMATARKQAETDAEGVQLAAGEEVAPEPTPLTAPEGSQGPLAQKLREEGEAAPEPEPIAPETVRPPEPEITPQEAQRRRGEAARLRDEIQGIEAGQIEVEGDKDAAILAKMQELSDIGPIPEAEEVSADISELQATPEEQEQAQEELGIFEADLAEEAASDQAELERIVAEKKAAREAKAKEPKVDEPPPLQTEPAPKEIELAAGIAPGKKAVAATKKWAKKNLTKMGDMPEPAFRAMIARDAEISGHAERVSQDGADYQRALKQTYGKKINVKDVRVLDQALKDVNKIGDLPDGIREPMGKFRRHIDEFSQHLIDIGAIEGPLVATVQENGGIYVHRAYKVHRDPKWSEKVPPEHRNRFKGLIRSDFPEKTDDQLEGLIDNLLFEGKAGDSPIAFLAKGGSKVGAKDLSILKRRKDILPELRALWGEYDDPLANYALTIGKMANLAANHKFLTRVREEGLNDFLFEEPVTNKKGKFIKKIAPKGSEAMNPLSGLYTTPEIEAAFREAQEGMPEVGKWLRHYMKFLTAAKIAKTVSSPQTQLRNVYANPMFGLVQGHWNVLKTKQAFQAFWGSVSTRAPQEWRDYVTDLKFRGVIGQEVHAGELKGMVDDATKATPDEFLDVSAGSTIWKKLWRVPQKLYEMGDAVFKVYGYENEKARYKKAGFSEAEAADIAADLVRNGYPSYSQIPRLAKIARRSPLIATFPSFPAAVIQISLWGPKQIKKELSSDNPKVRAIGRRRLAGHFLGFILGAEGLALASRWLLGISWEEDKKMREHVAPWEKEGSIIHLPPDEEGKREYLDGSFIDPFSYVRDPLMAVLRGDNPMDGLANGLKEMTRPFLSEDMTTQKILSTLR